MEYWLIQYVADPIRQERRNVGVVVLSHYGMASFIGIGSEPVVDVECFRPLAGAVGDDLWVYREWVGWFNDICRDAGKDLAEFRQRLEGLEERGLPFVARYGGLMETLPTETVKEVAKSLYEELVEEPVSTQGLFESRVEEIVTAAGLRDLSSFEEQVRIEFPAQKEFPGQEVCFDYLVDAPPRTAICRLPMHVGREAFARDVENAVAAFRTAIALEYVSPARSIVLSMPIP